MVLVIGSLGVGLGVTLWLSTDAAERSYQLSHARETNQALLQQKEALERQVLEAQAAPALAEAARNLGMIPSRDTAHLVQDPSGNWVVVGTPKPAQGVAPPPLNTPLPEEGPPAPRAAAPRVVEPREVTVRMPPRAPLAPAPLPGVEPSAPGAPAAPLAVPPGVEVPHAVTGQTPALGPAVAPAHRLPMCPQRPPSRPRTLPLCRLTQVRPRRPRPWPRHFPARPHEPRRQSGPWPGQAEGAQGATHPGALGAGTTDARACGRKWFAQCVIRVPASDGQRRHLRGAAGRRRAAVHTAGAQGGGPARRGGGSAQGHRRGEGRARCDRRPQQRQARLHHRGPRADLPAGQDPQAARRGQGENA